MNNGVRSYKEWSYFASNSSNLSAPFCFNLSNPNDISATVVDSSESMYDAVSQTQKLFNFDSLGLPPKDVSSELGLTQWLNFNSMGFSPTPMDAFSYGQGSNVTRTSLVKPKSYYPSYVLSPIGTPPSAVATKYCSSSPGFASLEGSSLGDYANNSPGLGFSGQSAALWNQTPEFKFNNGKSKQIADITSSVGEEKMHQGCLNLKGEALLLPHQMFGQGKNSVSKNAGQIEDKPCWWETVKPMPVELSAASFMRSPSAPLETHLAANYVGDSGSGNLHLSDSGSYDKDLRQHDKPSGVGTVSSPRTGLTLDLNINNTIADGDPGNNNLYNIKQAYHMPNPGTTGVFDLSYLLMQLDRDDHSSLNNAIISENNVSRHTVHDIFKEGQGFQNHHASLDNISLRLGAIEDVNSVEKSFDGGDRCNPAVDSPCWKGTLAAHLSPYEASVALPTEHVHKKADCFGSVIEEPRNFVLDNNNNMKYSCGNSKSCHHQEASIAGSPMNPSETKDASEHCNSDGELDAGSFQSESSYDCESGSSHTLHQDIEENKLMFQKQHMLFFGGADAGSNVNEWMEHSAPYPAEYALLNNSVAIDAPKMSAADAEYYVNKCMATLCPPEDDHFKRSLTVDALNTLEESAGNVSTKKLSVQVLVDTMHNLSELLLFHCSNDARELKERDQNVLKNVINNLNTCALENAKQFTSAQECLPLKPETFRGAGESCHLQQNSSFEKPQSTKVVPESSKAGFENPLVQEAKNLQFRSEKPHLKLSDSLSLRDKAEMTKEAKMTKALKKILSENFHDDEEADSGTVLYKNLWLEAEAELCSVSYRARYNQMKIEMENHSHKQNDMEEHSNPEVVPSLSENQSSATKAQIEPNLDSFLQDMHAFNATFVNHNTNGLLFSADMIKPNALTPEGKDTEDPDSSIHNSTASCTNKEVEDDEASVIARFQALKARVDNSCINAVIPEEPSGIAEEKLSLRQKNNQSQIEFYQDSSIPGKDKADYEASILTQLHILKSWFVDSSSESSESKLLDDDTNDETLEDKKADKSIPNEELLMDSPKKNQLGETCEDDNKLPTNYSDEWASDWEHV